LRIPPQTIDREVIDTFGESQWPFAIVFTKHDKLGQTEAQSNINTYKKDLLLRWEELPSMFVSSSETGRGRDEILAFIEESSLVFDAEKIKKAGF
jgi:GTP-binding protein